MSISGGTAMMKDTENTPPTPSTGQGETLKPYQTPKLTPLGSIHSLVRTKPGKGSDGGVGSNSAS
jgi:hypothetical protein